VVVVVDVDEETQLRRLVDLRGMVEADARARMAAQATRAQRVAAADVLVNNNGDLDDLVTEVNRVWRVLTAEEGGC